MKLFIVGPSETLYLTKLKALAEGMDIEFLVGLNVEELKNLYANSDILWSATGFGEDEFGRVETFGLSIAEAMACGCVPVVAGGGGVGEIVTHGVDGYIVATLAELIDKSAALLNDPRQRQLFSTRAISSVNRFRTEVFSNNLLEILSNIGDVRPRWSQSKFHASRLKQWASRLSPSHWR